MRLLYLVPDLFGPPGGIARYCGLVTRALCESADLEQLDVLALWDEPDARFDPRYLFGGKFTYRPFGGNQRAFALAAGASTVRRPYDVVMAGHVGFSPLLFAASARRHRSRRVSFIYGVDAWNRLPWHKRLSLRACDMVISISQYTADRAAAANGLNPNRLRLLYNCLDPALETDNSSSSTAVHQQRAFEGCTIVTVSRLARAEDKGHSAVLRALPAVIERVPDLHYLIVGDGDLRPDLKRMAVDLGVAHRTHFLGAISDAQVGLVLDSSDLYVMPGRNEGFGFVFLEAMARGLPIMAGIHDAAPEVIGPDAGVLVDADDVPQVANALVQLLSDAELRRRLADAGRLRLDAQFRYPRFKATLLSHLGMWS